jgi:hypothetical protein
MTQGAGTPSDSVRMTSHGSRRACVDSGTMGYLAQRWQYVRSPENQHGTALVGAREAEPPDVTASNHGNSGSPSSWIGPSGPFAIQSVTPTPAPRRSGEGLHRRVPRTLASLAAQSSTYGPRGLDHRGDAATAGDFFVRDAASSKARRGAAMGIGRAWCDFGVDSAPRHAARRTTRGASWLIRTSTRPIESQRRPGPGGWRLRLRNVRTLRS